LPKIQHFWGFSSWTGNPDKGWKMAIFEHKGVIVKMIDFPRKNEVLCQKIEK
jgi:hypothetical protein